MMAGSRRGKMRICFAFHVLSRSLAEVTRLAGTPPGRPRGHTPTVVWWVELAALMTDPDLVPEP